MAGFVHITQNWVKTTQHFLVKKRVTLPTTIFFFFRKHEEMYALDSDLK